MDAKLTTKEKIAYGLGDLGNGLMFQLAQLFLLKFYKDILQIPAYWGGLIFLVTKFFDAFADAGVGTYVDTQKKLTLGSIKQKALIAHLKMHLRV